MTDRATLTALAEKLDERSRWLAEDELPYEQAAQVGPLTLSDFLAEAAATLRALASPATPATPAGQDATCQHGTAMDVHCCNCHGGFLFDSAQCVCTFAPTPDQSEDGDLVNRITAAVREADRTFEKVGGSSRHWTRDCFLPTLAKHGLSIAATPATEGQELARLRVERDEWEGMFKAAEATQQVLGRCMLELGRLAGCDANAADPEYRSIYGAVRARLVASTPAGPQLTDYEAGLISGLLDSVSLGSKPMAHGTIYAAAVPDVRALIEKRQTIRAFFSDERDGRVDWWASEYDWAIAAAEWLEGDGRAVLGVYHRHWVQGLLFGYAPSEIDNYLERQEGRIPGSLPDTEEGRASRPVQAVQAPAPREPSPVSPAALDREALTHHYKGDNSLAFWDAVNARSDRHNGLYGLGCALQALEESVLELLSRSAPVSEEP